jgi:hypothetical protein
MARPEVTGRKISAKTEREVDDQIPGPRSADAGQSRPEVGSRKIGVESAKLGAHRIRGPPVTDDADAYSVAEFCRRHRISVPLFYKLRDQMPDTFKVGNRTLISKEAAERWRREREAAELTAI